MDLAEADGEFRPACLTPTHFVLDPGACSLLANSLGVPTLSRTKLLNTRRPVCATAISEVSGDVETAVSSKSTLTHRIISLQGLVASVRECKRLGYQDRSARAHQIVIRLPLRKRPKFRHQAPGDGIACMGWFDREVRGDDGRGNI